jgi:hypothetical protein
LNVLEIPVQQVSLTAEAKPLDDLTRDLIDLPDRATLIAMGQEATVLGEGDAGNFGELSGEFQPASRGAPQIVVSQCAALIVGITLRLRGTSS